MNRMQTTMGIIYLSSMCSLAKADC